MNRDSYDAIAAQWDEARRAFYGREQAYLDELLHTLKVPSRILDAGCGSGRPMAEYVVARGHNVVGVDQSERLLEIARRRFPTHQWIHASLEDYVPDGRHGAIVCWDALFHIPREHHAPILRRLAACLEPGGRIMLTVGGSDHSPFVDSMFGHPFFYDSHTPARTVEILGDLGFSILLGEFMNEPTGGRDKGRYAIVAESSSGRRLRTS